MEKVRAIAKFFDDHRPAGAPRVTTSWLLALGEVGDPGGEPNFE
jgi:hypothetical protein